MVNFYLEVNTLRDYENHDFLQKLKPDTISFQLETTDECWTLHFVEVWNISDYEWVLLIRFFRFNIFKIYDNPKR